MEKVYVLYVKRFFFYDEKYVVICYIVYEFLEVNVLSVVYYCGDVVVL